MPVFGVQVLKLKGLVVVPLSFTTANTVVESDTKLAVMVTACDAPAAMLAVVWKVPIKLAAPVVGFASYIATEVPAGNTKEPELLMVAVTVILGQSVVTVLMVIRASGAYVNPLGTPFPTASAN